MSGARRLQACVEAWPDAESGDYNPACCRFPKSCSPYPYPEQVALGNVELEPESEPVARDAASYGAPMHMPMGTSCQVHTHREWVPIEQHHVWPKGMGGPDTAANKVSVCANAHYSIHEVIRRLIANDGHLPDEKHFSAKVKALAVQGWTEAGKPTHGGGGE